MPPSDLDALRGFITRIHPLDDAAWTAFAEGWQPHIARRKTLLTAAGEVERYLYFVLDGVQRAFSLSDSGREATIVFTYPPSFAGVPDSLLTGLPSGVYFETLTASRFLRLRGENLQRLMEEHSSIRTMVMSSMARDARRAEAVGGSAVFFFGRKISRADGAESAPAEPRAA